MNKKVLSAILFGALMAGTGTFTSCIDTDEPAGIENLRGAKAELIRAKVAVETANAAYVNAEAALKLAEAKTEEARARYQAALAAKEEALAAQEAARTEEEKARIALEIAKYENEMKEIALTIQTSLAEKQQALAEAQFELQAALKQIEVAKKLGLSSLDEATIENLEAEVKAAYKKVYGAEGLNGLGGLVGQVYEYEQALYLAMMDKAAGFDAEGNQDAYIPELELAVARAEAAVEAEKESLAKLNEFLAKDAETTDWRAEIAELEDSVKLLDKAISEKGVEISKAENSPEAIAAKQAWEGVKDENGNVVKNGTQQELTAAIDEFNKYAKGGEEAIELTLSKIEVEPVAELATIVGAAVSEYNAEADRDVALWDGKKFVSPKVTYNQPEYGTEVTEATYKPAGVLAEVEAWIGALDKAIVSANDTALAKLQLAAAEQAVLDADTLNMEALELWEVALKAVNGTATAVPQDDIKKLIAAYHTAADAVTAAATAYNDKYDALYDAAYDAKVTEEYNKAYWDAFKAKAQTRLGDALYGLSATIADIITSIETLYDEEDCAGRIAKLESYYKPVTANEANNKKAAEDLTADKKAATTAANVKEAENDGWDTLAKAEGKAAVDAELVTDKALDKLAKAADKAVEDATKAYTAMTEGYTAYTGLAATAYAQVPTKKADETTFPAVAKVETKEGKKVATAPKMKDEDITNKLGLELKESLAQTALETTSNSAFGMGEKRAVAPTEAELRAYAEKNSVLLSACGTYGAYLDAQDYVASIKNKIAAVEKLAEVKAAAAAAKTALEAEIAANEAKFAELHAAVIAADAANIAAEKAYKAVTDEITLSLKIEEAKLFANNEAIKSVLSELTSAVNNHLGLDGITYDYDNFEADLKKAVEEVEDNVIDLEKALLVAQKDLQLVKEGKYDAVATAQRNLDAANAALTKAMEEYEEALSNLETALAIMAGEESAE